MQLKFSSLILLSMVAGVSFANTKLPPASSLTPDIVQLSPVVPGMGEHWANPKDMPLGPIYGVHKGKLIFFEFMISQEDFNKGMSFVDLKSKIKQPLPPVDHVDIDWEPAGHEGFPVPHYDIHLYFVSHEEHMAIK